MGKASRIKRERRDNPPPTPPTRRTLPVFWIAIAGLVVASVAGLIISSPSDREQAAQNKAEKVPAFAEVTTSGKALPTWSGTGSDTAMGKTVPALRGTNFDGKTMNLAPTDGISRVYIVVAHWCPHCQDEVPRIVKWSKTHQLSKSVEIVAVSTATSDSQDNYPPAAWLAREQWPYEVMIDDEVGTAAEALGVKGFPFLLFTDQTGKVVRRFSGEMPIDTFNSEINNLEEAHTDA